MPRRHIGWRQSKAIGNPHKLAQLQAIEHTGKSAIEMDPTAMIPGTGPEKLVFNYLKRLGIPFQFQYHEEDFESTSFPEQIWIPDFQIPDYNITIEVYGYYWHSQPRRREADILKRKTYIHERNIVIENGVPEKGTSGAAIGKYIIWWDYEIYADLGRLFARDCPELFSKDRVKNREEKYILDRKQQMQEAKARKASLIAAKLRPRPHYIEREIRKIRGRGRDLDKLLPPVLRQRRAFVKQRGKPKSPLDKRGSGKAKRFQTLGKKMKEIYD